LNPAVDDRELRAQRDDALDQMEALLAQVERRRRKSLRRREVRRYGHLKATITTIEWELAKIYGDPHHNPKD
jgi:hypothetical protein